MKLEELTDIYLLVLSSSETIATCNASIELRKKAIMSLVDDNIIKLAFDTRRIDQETTFIPRRGLQNYSRSEPFISVANIEKLKAFKKIKNVLEELKSEYGRQSAWQDSYCRVLLDTIDRALRTKEQDGDITDTQPGVGSLDYLEEMIYVRYRLSMENLSNMTEEEIKKALLLKDPELSNPDVADFMPKSNKEEKVAAPVLNTPITRATVRTENYDSLMDKLFGDVKASASNPNVERTVTITIKDKFGA